MPAQCPTWVRSRRRTGASPPSRIAAHRDCALSVEVPAAIVGKPPIQHVSSKACFVAGGGDGNVFFAQADAELDKLHNTAFICRLAIQSRLPEDWVKWLAGASQQDLELAHANFSVYVLAPGLREHVLPLLHKIRDSCEGAHGRLLVKIVTATSRLSSVVPFIWHVDPNCDLFSMEQVQFADPKTHYKHVNGGVWADAKRPLPPDLVGGLVNIVDDRWQARPHDDEQASIMGYHGAARINALWVGGFGLHQDPRHETAMVDFLTVVQQALELQWPPLPQAQDQAATTGCDGYGSPRAHAVSQGGLCGLAAAVPVNPASTTQQQPVSPHQHPQHPQPQQHMQQQQQAGTQLEGMEVFERLAAVFKQWEEEQDYVLDHAQASSLNAGHTAAGSLAASSPAGAAAAASTRSNHTAGAAGGSAVERRSPAALFSLASSIQQQPLQSSRSLRSQRPAAAIAAAAASGDGSTWTLSSRRPGGLLGSTGQMAGAATTAKRPSAATDGPTSSKHTAQEAADGSPMRRPACSHTNTMGSVQQPLQQQSASHLDAAVLQPLFSQPQAGYASAAAIRRADRAAAGVGSGSAAERQGSVGEDMGDMGAGSSCGGSSLGSRPGVGSGWAGPSSSNQQQQQQGVGAAAQTISLVQVQQLLLRDLDAGELHLKPGMLHTFASSHRLAVTSSSESFKQFKLLFMGNPTSLIKEAKRMRMTDKHLEGVQWEGVLLTLQQDVGLQQLEVWQPEFKPIKKLRHVIKGGPGADSCLLVRVEGTMTAKLPAAMQQPGADPDDFKLTEDFALLQAFAEQPIDAPYIRFSLQEVQDSEEAMRQSKLGLSAKVIAKTEAALQRKLRGKLYAVMAALLKWQLRWQLPEQQRQYLEAGSLGQLVLPTAANDIALAPTLGVPVAALRT